MLSRTTALLLHAAVDVLSTLRQDKFALDVEATQALIAEKPIQGALGADRGHCKDEGTKKKYQGDYLVGGSFPENLLSRTTRRWDFGTTSVLHTRGTKYWSVLD